VSGQLFFGSTTKFGESFTPSEDPGHVIIDMEFAHIWDHSGVIALAKTINKYENMGKKVELTRLNDESLKLVTRVGLQKPTGH
jgi:SulP family sulfate permease